MTGRRLQPSKPEPIGLADAAEAGAATSTEKRDFAARLLAWYDRHRRVLPWRAPAGHRADPYAVWLSEIMLQQTTVAAVGPYFRRFLERWPTVDALAAASLDDVLTLWAGLGYYARARNLHKCARMVSAELDGRFPDTEAGLRALPGIGAYTAAAIAAIAFDRPATILDGNVERVIARQFAVEDPLPRVKPRLRALAETLTPARRPGDYAQAMMDLGATVCVPVKPKCLLCPVSEGCEGTRLGIAETLPRKMEKPVRPTRYGTVFWLIDAQGAVLLRRRAERGLLGGMIEFPGTAWTTTGPPTVAEVEAAAPVSGVVWTALSGGVRHTFTHFHLELTVWAGTVTSATAVVDAAGFWVALDALGDQALPSVMRKVVRHALAHAGRGVGSSHQ